MVRGAFVYARNLNTLTGSRALDYFWKRRVRMDTSETGPVYHSLVHRLARFMDTQERHE